MEDEVKAVPTDEGQVEPTEAKPLTAKEVKDMLSEHYNKMNSIFSKQGAELAKLRKAKAPADGTDQTLEILLADRKSRKDEYGDNDPVLNQLEAEVARRKHAGKIQQQQVIRDERKEELYGKLEEAGIDISDDTVTAELDMAIDLAYALDGDFTRAERVVKKLVKSAKPKGDESKMETEVQIRERIKREVMEEMGLTKPEKNTPSGSGRTFTQKQIDGMSMKEYMENRDEISAAISEGRVK